MQRLGSCCNNPGCGVGGCYVKETAAGGLSEGKLEELRKGSYRFQGSWLGRSGKVAEMEILEGSPAGRRMAGFPVFKKSHRS